MNRIGLGAAILLVPGGLILGAALAVRRYRQRADAAETAPVKADPV